jgi:hypothetical protein
MNPESVQSREGLGRFVESLAQDFLDHREEWQNTDLEAYLESMSAWIADMNGVFRNLYGTDAPEQPTWELFARILLAPTVYE